MKRLFALVLSLFLAVSLVACGNSNTVNESAPSPSGEGGQTNASDHSSAVESPSSTEAALIPESSESAESDKQGRVLVAYFSWADNAVLSADVDAITSPSVVAPGNVMQLAGWVHEIAGGDLFSIRVTEPYSSDWDECLERANQERGNNARPELLELVENMDDYETVFLGYPNWWYGAPMAVLSFLEQHDLSGKTVYLFCSHGTGGLAGSVQDIAGLLPNSSISDSIFDVYEEDVASSRDEIESWLDGLGY